MPSKQKKLAKAFKGKKTIGVKKGGSKKTLKKTLKRKRYDGIDLDEVAAKLGASVSKRIQLSRDLPEMTVSDDLNTEVMRRFINDDDDLKEDRAINRIYRAAHKAQDELFSTALTRELIKGIMSEKGWEELDEDEEDYLTELIDIPSAARLPTFMSGHATKDSVMQHPANRSLALFADPYDTASEHSHFDTERREYVSQAMEEALEKGEKGDKILIEGVKAAIEYTLNYFTAPITAKNVLPYSRAGQDGYDDEDDELIDQVRARELMKEKYIELGGTLRSEDEYDDDEEPMARPWDNSRPSAEEVFVRAPSPFRMDLDVV